MITAGTAVLTDRFEREIAANVFLTMFSGVVITQR
jgi:hypothetical protein